MTQYAIILTEDVKNKSVCIIATELSKKIEEFTSNLQVLILNADDIQMSGEHLVIGSRSTTFFEKTKSTNIHVDEIAVVLVRTWTEKRYLAWEICQVLIEYQVAVVDAQLIPWTHSKIAQYQSLAHEEIFPPSICLDENWMKSCCENPSDLEVLIQRAIIDVDNIGYPCVIKTSHGSRGTGVYRALNQEGLHAFLHDYLSNRIQTPEIIKKTGLIIQHFIPPIDTSISRSIYLRINVVDQKISSVVQFELGWEPFMIQEQPQYYERLIENIEQPQDRPIEISELLNRWFLSIKEIMPHKFGVVGLDVMIDQTGKYRLLEVNSGPMVSLIVELGQQYSHTVAGQQCLYFGKDIAEICLQQAFKQHRCFQVGP